MNEEPLLKLTPAGLYCAAGDFYIDPWRSVPKAVITHAHSDHARRGMKEYLAAKDSLGLLLTRLGQESPLVGLEYGETLRVNGVKLSLHPAGHILGSAQVRVEYRGEVWVASGDYKVQPDPTCQAFEPVRCHTFITESTFGLPIYRWRPPESVAAEINHWWRTNADEGHASLLMGYSLGKAQRLIACLDPSIGPIFTHSAVETLNMHYRAAGIALPPTQTPDKMDKASDPAALKRAILVAPPSAQSGPWLKKFGPLETAFASGWMTIRGTRRRQNVDRGFVLSDHADWPDLIGAIRATEATRILVTHGASAVLVRWLRDRGWDANALATPYGATEDEN